MNKNSKKWNFKTFRNRYKIISYFIKWSNFHILDVSTSCFYSKVVWKLYFTLASDLKIVRIPKKCRIYLCYAYWRVGPLVFFFILPKRKKVCKFSSLSKTQLMAKMISLDNVNKNIFNDIPMYCLTNNPVNNLT